MKDGHLSDSALGAFPEPIAVVDHDLVVHTKNAAWQATFSGASDPLAAAHVEAALRRVLAGDAPRLDTAFEQKETTYSISIVPVAHGTHGTHGTHGDSRAALVHARAAQPSVPKAAPTSARTAGDTLEASLLRRVLHLLPISIGLADEHGKNLFMNETGARLLGRTRGEIEGKSHHDFLDSADSAIAREVEARVFATGTEEIVTMDLNTPLGPRSIFLHFIPLAGSSPDERLVVFVGQDVTEQLRAERDLREQQDFIRQVIDSDPSLLFVKDGHGTFLLANKAIADVFGRSVEEMVGQHDRVINDNDIVDDYLAADKRVIETLEELTVEEPVLWASGEVRWYQTTKRPLVRPNGEVQVLACAVDITARREAMKKLEEAAAEVEARAREALRQAESKAALVEELDQKLAIIETQHQEILSLSAPLLDVGESILAVPIVGAMSDARAVEIMTRLLDAIVERQVERVVLDLTGLEVIETNTADQLLGIVRAIRLLGAEAIISGIRPAVAQTIVDLGLDLSTLKTHRNLRSAIFTKGPAPKARRGGVK